MAKITTIKKQHFNWKKVSLCIEKILGTILLLLLQISFIFLAYWQLNTSYLKLQLILSVLSIIVVLSIINQPINPSYKLTWSVTILFVPIFGGLFYLLLATNSYRRHFRKSILENEERSKLLLHQSLDITRQLCSFDKQAQAQANYLYCQTKYPIYSNTSVTYYPSGEEMFPALLAELSHASHFIFLEFFIIQEGIFWNAILEILKQKAKAGVDVRLIYDDFGCIATLPKNFAQSLQHYGIRCHTFNPLRPILSLRHNNRDHKKLVIIDGVCSFTGGFNLADEYINQTSQNGYWKDTGILLNGEATWSFTTMFLQIWDHLSGDNTIYAQYKPQIPKEFHREFNGFVQPYANNPMSTEEVAEKVYLNLIQRATKYVYITTPYLVLDHEMITALSLAAQSGVDVRILTPGIPDKRTVFMVSRSFYEPLLNAGVKIFEYTPGFLHAKMMFADDRYAVIGSVNLDYRSLYLHFECATFLYSCDTIREVKIDWNKMLSASEEITLSYCKNLNRPYRLWQSLLRLYAPLL